MENTNNIMLMLNKIENSLNELSRRVSALEGRQNIAQPMRVNPVPNTSPYNIRPLPMFKPNFKPNEMYVLHGNNPRSPQYIINKGIEQLKELNAITLDYFIRCRKQGYITDVNNGPNGDSVFDKIEAIELTLLQGLNNLQHNYSQHNYNIELNNINISKEVGRLHDKYCYSNIPYVQEPTQFVMEKLNAIKHDINVLLSNHITIQDIKTVNNSNVNYTPISSSITQENLSDIQEWVNNTRPMFQQTTTHNKSSNYRSYSDRPINPIIDNIIDALTNRHKINLTVFEKNALHKLKSLDSIPEDIYNHVNSLHLHVTQYKCVSEIIQSLLSSITDMMYDRGYMCKVETVNDKPMDSGDDNSSKSNDLKTVLEIIEQANIKLNILKTHMCETVTPNRDMLFTRMNNISFYIELYLDNLRKNNNKILEDKYFICRNISLEIINEIDGYLVGVNKSDIRYGVDYYDVILKNIENIFNKYNIGISNWERYCLGEDTSRYWQSYLSGDIGKGNDHLVSVAKTIGQTIPFCNSYKEQEAKATSKPKEVSMSEKIEFIKHFYTKDTFIRISKAYQDALDWLAQQKNLSNDISNKINMIYIKIKASKDKHLGYVTVVHEALNELSDLLDNILANNKNSVENIEWVDQNSNVKKPTIDKSKPIVQKPKRQQVRKR